MSKIKVPAKARKDPEALVKLIEAKNYKVDHVKKVLRPKQQRGKQITLKSAEELTKPKTDPAVNKAKREAKKVEKEAEKQKELKLAKREAVKEFKTKQNEAKQKAFKKKNIKGSIEKMKGQEKEVVDFYGKSDKTYKNPPATNQPVKKKEEPVKKVKKVKKLDIRGQIREELTKIENKYYGDNGGLKKNKYTTEGNNPIRGFKISKKGDRYKIITQITTKELLMDFYNKEIKDIPVLNENLILSTNNYDNGKQIKTFLVNN